MAAKYRQLADILREQLPELVNHGASKLPTEAELCLTHGVSRQTVRHALSILEEEGYISRRQGSGSHIRRRNASGDVRQIAVISSFIDDYIFPTILHDAQNAFARSGYSTLIYSTENRVSTEREILTGLLSRPVSGILIEGSKSALPTPNEDLYRRLRANGIPILFLHGMYSNLSGFPCIYDDNCAGGYQLTSYLVRKGHRRLAAVFKSDDVQGPQRYQGMVNALRDADISIPDTNICWYDTEQRRSLIDNRDSSFIDDILKKRLGNATAVICYNDEIAHALIQRALELGKRVPEDLAVVSFDNSYYSQIGPVPITSLGHKEQRSRNNRTGCLAAQTLLDMLNGQTVNSFVLEWDLIERQSG